MEVLLKAVGVFIIFLIAETSCQDYNDGVEDLECESVDFRSISLRWRYSSSSAPPSGFAISLCEGGQKHGCFERHLMLGRGVLRGHDALSEEGKGHYRATLFGLRMLTNYSVEVRPLGEGWARRAGVLAPHNHPPHTHQRILVATKGFSAYATNCLSNSSDIVVHTGPYFGGKIAVEGGPDRCALYGNRSIPQDTYTLHIDHRLCGSETVNDSRIDTVVVVHESSSVVTHNSRRFLVQCTFLPDTFTIKAAFNIPQNSEVEKKNFNYRQLEDALKNLDSNDIYTYDHYKQNSVKDSRMSSEQAQSILQGNLPGYESQMLSLLVVVIVLVIVAVAVVGFSLWCYHLHRRRSADIETLSTTSGTSFMAYHQDPLVVRPYCEGGTFPSRTPFLPSPNQVALVSLKPVKELY